MENEKTSIYKNDHLKAWQLIIELIKHPFSNVVFCNYIITNIRYKKYDKKYILDSIDSIPKNKKVLEKPND